MGRREMPDFEWVLLPFKILLMCEWIPKEPNLIDERGT